MINYEKTLSLLAKDIKYFSKIKKKDIKLVIVTKAQKIDAINTLVNLGYTTFGENYVQEAVEKIKIINKKNICWHYIGKIQSNKIKQIVQYFDWIQTISSLKHVKIINSISNDFNKIMNVCIQVNIDEEISKSGLNINELEKFIESIKNYENIKVRGIMSIPSKPNALKGNENSYKILKLMYDNLCKKYKGFDTLSLGMSNDYKLAMKNGSNLIRVGTLIFGKRDL